MSRDEDGTRRLASLLGRLLGISWPPEVLKDGVSEPFFQKVKSNGVSSPRGGEAGTIAKDLGF